MTQGPSTALGQMLESGRQAARISGREAARRAGISETRWRQVTVAGQVPPARTVVALARAVGVDLAAALDAAGYDSEPDIVDHLVGEIDQEPSAPSRPVPQGDLVAEIERIKGLPLAPADKIRIVNALIELYHEKAQRDGERADRTALA